MTTRSATERTDLAILPPVSRPARPLVALAGLLLCLPLAGCGDDDEGSTLPDFTGGAGASGPSASAPSSSSAPVAGAFPDTAAVSAGKISASGEQERHVADAWVAYWTARVKAYHEVDSSSPELSEVATGAALSQVQDYVRELRSRGHHTVGTLSVSVSGITVKGDTATLRSCLDNRTIDVDRRLRPVEPPTPRYAMKGTATREGDTWRVSKVAFQSNSTC